MNQGDRTAVWIYRVQMLSKRGSYVFGYQRAMTDDEYNIPELRAVNEQMAEAGLRELEGVTPDMPIEHLGWTHWAKETEDDGR